MQPVSPHSQMNHSETGAKRRLARLERLLAGRRARYAATLTATRRQHAGRGPIGGLQTFGYPVAILLALTAVLPTVIGFGWRRRRLLSGAAVNGLAIRSLRKRFGAAEAKGRR